VILKFPAKKKPEFRPEPVYACLKCDGDIFKLAASGKIHCGNCGALMNNIEVKVCV
jgi:hypothetical protein